MINCHVDIVDIKEKRTILLLQNSCKILCYDFLSWKFNEIFYFLFVEILFHLWNFGFFWIEIQNFKVEALVIRGS